MGRDHRMTSEAGNLVDRFHSALTKSPTLRVEQFVEQHQQADVSQDELLELIYTEILLRNDNGEDLQLGEYLQRFPQFEKRLRGMFQLQLAMSPRSDFDLPAARREDRLAASNFRSLQSVKRQPRSLLAGSDDPQSEILGEHPSGTSAAAASSCAGTLDDAPSTLASKNKNSERGPLPEIPGYVVEAELGRGGMGVVYRARQLGLNRTVALKMIRAGGHAEQEELDRFRREASAIARLQHPHIVQIYAIGEINGLPFFSLEYCDQGALDKTLRGTPQPARESAELVEKLAQAVEVAHQQGVIHRDLKPANVLIGNDGRPKLTDFGLAKQTDLQASGHTRSGAILGTPSYMAPEQAQGDARHVGPAADVYALGAILYELLTGRPPFKAANPFDTIRQVLELDPVTPVSLNQAVPVDLNTICLKCLEKKSERRYATARELSAELSRYLRGEPILARPISRAGRVLRWCHRNPAVAKLSAAVVAVSIVFVVGLVLSLFTMRAQRNEARTLRDKADEALDQANKNLNESQRQRERAHYYLESFLKLDRFGRELVSVPLRHDFDLKVRSMARTDDNVPSASVKKASPLSQMTGLAAEASLPEVPPAPPTVTAAKGISLVIEADADCFVTVFYAPSDAADRCVQLFPNRVTSDNLVRKGTSRTILNEPNLIFRQPESHGSPSYLYILATSLPWNPTPPVAAGEGEFGSFSGAAQVELKQRIASLFDRSDAKSAGTVPLVSEEILLFDFHDSPSRRSRLQGNFPFAGNSDRDRSLPKNGRTFAPSQRFKVPDAGESLLETVDPAVEIKQPLPTKPSSSTTKSDAVKP